jgi:hypothetical protein
LAERRRYPRLFQPVGWRFSLTPVVVTPERCELSIVILHVQASQSGPGGSHTVDSSLPVDRNGRDDPLLGHLLALDGAMLTVVVDPRSGAVSAVRGGEEIVKRINQRYPARRRRRSTAPRCQQHDRLWFCQSGAAVERAPGPSCVWDGCRRGCPGGPVPAPSSATGRDPATPSACLPGPIIWTAPCWLRIQPLSRLAQRPDRGRRIGARPWPAGHQPGRPALHPDPQRPHPAGHPAPPADLDPAPAVSR